MDTPTGDEIRAHRERRGLSRRQVSEIAQVDQSTIRRIERGEFDNPRKLAPVLAAIGWGVPHTDMGPRIRDLTGAQLVAELIAELARRMAELEDLRVQVRRLTTVQAPLAGSLPPSHQDRPGDDPAQPAAD